LAGYRNDNQQQQMPTKRTHLQIAAFTAPAPLLKAARARAGRIYGPRKFSMHVRSLLSNDLNEQRKNQPSNNQ
jgi:hypothetical protein